MNALTDVELDRVIGEDVNAIHAALADRQKHLEAAAGCEKSAVLTAWQLGGRLREKKKRLSHGAWLPWLKAAGIGERSARDYLRLAREIGSAADLRASVRETLASLPAPTPTKRAPKKAVADIPSGSTPVSKPDPFVAVEASLDAERARNEGLIEKLAIVSAQLDPEQLDQLDGLRAQISTLKSQINECISKCGELQRDRNNWRKRAKTLEKNAPR